ncbi:hypothetical protein GFY24_39895 [Nocardia sp. SYP-A9097]|uniref:YncE family protein n=1 Tax=Nocardia sp. SYP-A9097 TaxID=2663237 RepID=UPI00129A5DC4|nr:YncE family protein [Nocardia sp. SYP-A9097]MRH93499.1 hypothetical protein [Nocardia sp. SYP-A9097]
MTSVVADRDTVLRLSRATAVARWRSPAGLGFIAAIPLILMGRRIVEVVSAAGRADLWFLDLIVVYFGLLAVTVVIGVLVTGVRMMRRDGRVMAYAAAGSTISVRFQRDSLELGLATGTNVVAYNDIRDLFAVGGSVFLRVRGSHGVALPRELFPEAAFQLMGRRLGGRRAVGIVAAVVAVVLVVAVGAWVLVHRNDSPHALTVRKSIPLECSADTFTVYADTAYLACWDDNVRILDIASGTVTAVIPVGPNAHGIAFDPTTRRLYVANSEIGGGNSRVSVVDTDAEVVRETIPFARGLWRVAIDVAAHRLYVGGHGLQPQHDTIGIIDTLSSAAIGEVPVDRFARDIVVDPATNTVYVGFEAPAPIHVIDPATMAVTATIPFGDRIRGLDVDSETHTLYAVGDGNSSSVDELRILKIIDTTTGTVRSTVPLAPSVWAVAVDSTDHSAYTLEETYQTKTDPEAGTGSVRVVDTETGAVNAPVIFSSGDDVGVLAEVAVDPVTHRVYALEVHKIHMLSR